MDILMKTFDKRYKKEGKHTSFINSSHPFRYLFLGVEVVESQSYPTCDDDQNDEQQLFRCITIRFPYLHSGLYGKDEADNPY